jgi:cell division protein ZapA
MKSAVDVEIMGHRFTVASDEDEAHVRGVAEYVDGQMRRLADGRTTTTIVQLALLTALNIASEYWKLRHEQEELDRMISQLSHRLAMPVEGGESGPGKEQES